MTIDRDHPLVREAERILAQYSSAACEAIAADLYGARDARLAIAVLELVRRPCELETQIEALKDQLEELRSEKNGIEEQNAEDEAHLRKLLGDALEIIEANCSGFVDLCDNLRAEADL